MLFKQGSYCEMSAAEVTAVYNKCHVFKIALISKRDTSVKWADTFNNMSRGKEEMLFMFGLIILWRHNHHTVCFRLPISYLCGATKLEHNKSSGNRYMHHQNQSEMRGAALISLFGSAPGFRKSWRVEEKKKRIPLSDKHHLLSEAFFKCLQQDLWLLSMYSWLFRQALKPPCKPTALLSI